mgnify:CR=1 FL=1
MKKRVFALFTAMFLLCGMLAGCGPTGSSSTTTDGSDDGAKDTVISTGIYEAMEFGYWMEDGTTGEWQAITLDHTGFYWRDAALDRLTHFHQFAVYGVKF